MDFNSIFGAGRGGKSTTSTAQSVIGNQADSAQIDSIAKWGFIGAAVAVGIVVLGALIYFNRK